MNSKTLAVLCLAAALVAGTFVFAQSSAPSTAGDPRLDKILEQNEKILKNQEEMQKDLAEIKDWVNWLRRRSS